MFSSFPKYRLPDNLTSTNCSMFFSLFSIFTLVSNRPQGFFLIFLVFRPRLQQPQGFFLIFLVFCPRHLTDIQPYSRYSPIPDHPDHITGNKKAKNKRSIIHARLFSAYFSSFQNVSSFQNISHHSGMSHHSRISLITPEYLPSFQNVSHHSEMSLNFPAYPGCQILFIILAVRSYLFIRSIHKNTVNLSDCCFKVSFLNSDNNIEL